MKKQVHVLFSGRVQGIGFRFTAENIAAKLGICGWVKNLNDGRVEILVEGEEKTLKDFLAELNQYFAKYIRDTGVEWTEATNKFKDFGVEF